MTNNDILKKLRVALQLRDDQIIEILELVDFRVSKGEIGNFFRNEDHPKYVECQDQILRNFLNGLVIFLRGTKENPKNPKDVLAGISASKKPLIEKTKTDSKPKNENIFKKITTPKPNFKSNVKTAPKSNTPTKKDVLGNVKFNNGKPNKKNDQ
ncbi:DUF1456 family protein [Myroides sp. JBRI-B21084]|uniref:DUF1456 family protein n=1 Tax=Myroides sp. JBRI-B21084 TaxID=3119977 RepID=UPI0026E1AA72|nr:DUF1456 family protein [Paenimyroides cloacae]WKW45691.1 DUF1456 family protein [Paenimyroides cloacae]